MILILAIQTFVSKQRSALLYLVVSKQRSALLYLVLNCETFVNLSQFLLTFLSWTLMIVSYC